MDIFTAIIWASGLFVGSGIVLFSAVVYVWLLLR